MAEFLNRMTKYSAMPITRHATATIAGPTPWPSERKYAVTTKRRMMATSSRK